MTFNGSVTEVVIPHKGWDGDGHCVVDVGTGTDYMQGQRNSRPRAIRARIEVVTIAAAAFYIHKPTDRRPGSPDGRYCR